MSTEKDREFRDRCDVYFEGDGWLSFDDKECDLDHLVTQCLQYARQGERERLIELLAFADKYNQRAFMRSFSSHADCVREFLEQEGM